MRKFDTGWRDSQLTYMHAAWGFEIPTAGTVLPMIEYDYGTPVALISYHSRQSVLPRGENSVAAHRALGILHRDTGEQLPMFTVVYDTRNWAMKVMGHNGPATVFLGAVGWVEMPEFNFAVMLYRLRGRYMPDLAPYGVRFNHSHWIPTEPSPEYGGEAWPGQLMSTRRRQYEPTMQTRASWRNPCLDVDLAVVDQDDHVALVVDYKAEHARINLDSHNMKALSSLYVQPVSGPVRNVAAMVCQYRTDDQMTRHFTVSCLNQNARMHLAFALGQGPDENLAALAHTITNGVGVSLTEQQWMDVLNIARHL